MFLCFLWLYSDYFPFFLQRGSERLAGPLVSFGMPWCSLCSCVSFCCSLQYLNLSPLAEEAPIRPAGRGPLHWLLLLDALCVHVFPCVVACNIPTREAPIRQAGRGLLTPFAWCSLFPLLLKQSLCLAPINTHRHKQRRVPFFWCPWPGPHIFKCFTPDPPNTCPPKIDLDTG